jgi:PHP family Zn ribbon phosphoesterase
LCYKNKSVTPTQIVDAALASGLEVIAITDHNTFEAVDDIRKEARTKGIYVFPGAELTTKSGHFIALFDIESIIEDLRNILVQLKLDKHRWGDATAIIEGSTRDVIEHVGEHGGIVVAAHIERWPSGVLESGASSREKMDILSSPFLSALEITVPQNKVSWNGGKMHNYARRFACIQSSDAHSLEETGRRHMFIKMDNVNLESLKSAFTDFENRLAFPDDLIRTNNELT